VRHICIAAIKRKVQTASCKYTQIYEVENFEEIDFINRSDFSLESDELPIMSLRQVKKRWWIFGEQEHWWAFTTHKIIGKINGRILSIPLEQIQKINWGDWKGYQKKEIITITVQFGENQIEKLFLETGRAALIPIYTVMNVH
jgi:hypothetical protein